MDWVAWTLVGVAALAFAVGAWAVRGDPSRGRRRCPRCAYDMGGLTGLRCPECGRDARAERALFRTRRRWRTAGAAGVVCLAALVALGWHAVSAAQWLRISPNSLLVPLAGTARFQKQAEFELWRRVGGSNAAGMLPRRDALRRWQWRSIADKDAPDGRDEGLRAIATWALTEPRTPTPMSPEALVEELCDRHWTDAEAMYGALDQPALPECMNAVHRDQTNLVRLTTGGPLGELCAVKVRWALTWGGEVWVFSRPPGGEWRVVDRVLCIGGWKHEAYRPQLHESPDGGAFVVIRADTGGTGGFNLSETWYEVSPQGLRPALDRVVKGYASFSCYPDLATDSSLARIGSGGGKTFLEFDRQARVMRGDRLDKPLWSRGGVARYTRRPGERRFGLSAHDSAWSARELAREMQPGTDLRFRERLLMEDIAAGLRARDAAEREQIEGIAECFGGTGPGPRIKDMLEASPPAR